MKLTKTWIFAALLVCVVLTVGMAGCIGSDTPAIPTPTAIPTATATQTTAATPAPTASAISGEINVFAAASLTGVLGEMGKQFEAENKNIKVNFNFAGSQS